MWYRILFVLLIFTAFSCEKTSEREKEIEQVEVDFEVVRFDRKFAELTPESLPSLKAEYPFLFPEQYSDSVWLARIQDTIQQELSSEVGKAFPDFSAEEEELHSLFQHVKYYFPSFEAPLVITVTSDVDYKNKALLTDDFLFISLDTYLGVDHDFYLGIQQYLKKNFERAQIIPDVAAEYAKKYVPKPASKTFLAQMLYYGKILYLKDLWLPDTGDAAKIGYTSEELGWAEDNEEMIWRYFVERQMIFASDNQLLSRFLYPGPFSRFYLELDNESPARIGQYIGWQIIRSYMDKNQVDVQEMLQTDAETIFKNANYKPRK